MMQLPFIIETVGRMWVLSGVLLLIYTLLARRKADYRACRRLLMAVPLCCMAVPLLQFAGGKLSELREPRHIELTVAEAEEYIRRAPARYVWQTDAPQPSRLIEAPQKTDYSSAARVAANAIPAVSGVLLALMGLQLGFISWRCRRMARQGTLSEGGVVRSAKVDTPFSFGRRIFLPQAGLTAEGERMVVMHERAHIALGHTAESLLMEALCRLLWFNPLMWMARRELRHVQEFEADRRVLDVGTEVLAYQTLLLETVMQGSPALTDGFNSSFVRRRFVEMKTAGRHRLSPKWKTTVGLLTVCVTALAAAGPVREVVDMRIIGTDAPTAFSQKTNADANADNAPADKALADSIGTQDAPEEQPEATDDTPANGDERPARAADGWPILYDLPCALRYEDDMPNPEMRHLNNETHLVFTWEVESDDEFHKFGGPGSYIVDPATGVHYKARRSIPAEAWDHFHLRGMEGRAVQVTVVFPRIPDTVSEIALYRVTGHLETDLRLPTKYLQPESGPVMNIRGE